eukprot:TRINITY_DN36883_c0_g1_i1.p1 TRINITY_DN36883_c0_g1~~TRINITY_DN36883_c0_g1_i1.p1  ORF type:complete len:616 (+),score=153.63 TRINITY_DN36883_c0_g1_i1:78-1925(+)
MAKTFGISIFLLHSTLLRAENAATEFDDSVLLQQGSLQHASVKVTDNYEDQRHARGESSVRVVSLSTVFVERVKDGTSMSLFGGAAVTAAVIGGGIFLSARGAAKKESAQSDITADRWHLIVMSGMVQVVAGSVYAMGAWQDELRDSLGITVDGVSAIGAATFAGSLAATLGGTVFDLLGPKAAVTLGATAATMGYLLIGFTVVAGDMLSPAVKLLVCALGAMMAGYSSVSLMDNPVCMACSMSFPNDRASVVGYLKAVLATAAGLWALLWVHVFKPPHGPGLPAFLGFTAAASLGLCIIALPGIQTLPPDGPHRRQFSGSDSNRLYCLIAMLVALSFFDVSVSFFFSQGKLVETSSLGYIGCALAMLPFSVLQVAKDIGADAGEVAPQGGGPATSTSAEEGLKLTVAVTGIDFWLLWIMQFAVFGAGVATNQNLALILESAGNPSASGLGVALFALTSSLSRVAVGILSDKYGKQFTRFNWLTLVAANACAGQFLVSIMSFGSIMLGTLLMGLSFGAFFTVIVPVVNEMYGKREFGSIMGSQLASQAAAAFSICLFMLPKFYKKAAAGKEVCEGAACFQTSFMIMMCLNVGGLASAIWLQARNKEDMPMHRMSN